MIKIAVYGLSGAGKSSTAKLIQKYYKDKNIDTKVLKLAYPLYEIQKIFYDTAGKDIDFYAQDQILLESIASNLRKISESSLVDNFMERLRKCTAAVVINDDIRDYKTDYPVLKKEGFRFIKIFCDETVRVNRLMNRKDLSVNIESSTTNDLDRFEPDFSIDTSSSELEILEANVYRILDKLDRGMS